MACLQFTAFAMHLIRCASPSLTPRKRCVLARELTGRNRDVFPPDGGRFLSYPGCFDVGERFGDERHLQLNGSVGSYPAPLHSGACSSLKPAAEYVPS